MKKIHYIAMILIAVIPLSITSCKDDSIPYVQFTRTDKGMVPYKLGDEVCFMVKDQTEQVTFTVTDDVTEWHRYCDHGDCFMMPFRNVSLCSDDSVYTLGVLQCLEPDGKRLLSFGKDLNRIECYFGSMIMYDKKGHFRKGEITYYAWDEPLEYSWSQEVLNSLRIGDHVYYDVLRKTTSSGSDTLLYNKAYGVLQVVEEGEPLLTRIP